MFAIAYEESDYDHHECDPFLYVETLPEAEAVCKLLRKQSNIKLARKVRAWLKANEPLYAQWLRSPKNYHPFFSSYEGIPHESTNEMIEKSDMIIKRGCVALGIIDVERMCYIMNRRELEIPHMQKNYGDYSYYELKKYELTPS